MRVRMCDENAQSLAKKVVGDFVRPLITRQIKLAMAADGVIDRVLKPGLVKSIEISVEKDFIACSAFRIERGLQVDDPLSQSAGLIRADHIHAAEVFDRSELFDYD